MKNFFLTLLLVALCAATGYGQTLKSLSYNTTNGQVVAATNVVWTNAFNFSTNAVAAQVRTNLSLGATWLTNNNVTNFRTAIGLGLSSSPSFSSLAINGLQSGFVVITTGGAVTSASQGIQTASVSVPAWSGFAWTNMSMPTLARALAGSTNTNEPYSGSINLFDVNEQEVLLTISNGIIVSVSYP
jgi:hypothetical protein